MPPLTAIPRWMTALNLVVVGILAFKTWACFFNPAAIFGPAGVQEPAHIKALWELGGRNIAMIAVSLYALARPTAASYVAVFLLGLFREGADMVFALALSPGDAKSAFKAAAFLLFLVPYGVALKVLARR